MNKLGFISGIITSMLVFLQFIPLGIYFGIEGSFSNWIVAYLGIQNPLFDAYSTLPLNLFTYESQSIFLWGMIINGNLYSWLEINILSFICLTVLSLICVILSFIGCVKRNKTGKRLLNLNLVVLIFIIIYSIIGIPIYSQELLGVQFGYFDIFLYLNYGFYIIIINLIIASFAYIKHPTI